MTEPQPELLDATFVKIIHPGTGGTAEVPVTALGASYAAGWRRLVEGDVPHEAAPGEPPPLTQAQVNEGLSAKRTSTSKGKE
jgi:hypothetical protein